MKLESKTTPVEPQPEPCKWCGSQLTYGSPWTLVDEKLSGICPARDGVGGWQHEEREPEPSVDASPEPERRSHGRNYCSSCNGRECAACAAYRKPASPVAVEGEANDYPSHHYVERYVLMDGWAERMLDAVERGDVFNARFCAAHTCRCYHNIYGREGQSSVVALASTKPLEKEAQQ